MIRIDDDRVTEKIFLARPYVAGKSGRPRLRWIDCTENDQKTINVRNRKSQARRTGQPGMEFLGRPRSTLLCHTIEEGR
ncbi:hypothetical protein TNCV_3888111 [Trichonephila clavipes]|nr:hypothetical protein TNCV_3888111 [Trichonephila clavipes]